MPRAIGIDLGTTNTAVAVLEGGRPRVLEDERGYKVLPSVVSAKGEGRFIVGQAAHSLIITNPDATVYAVKRLLGRRFDSPEVQKVLSHVQYKLRPGPDGGVQLQIGDQWMTPSEVSAVILQVARGIAERALGEPVEEAVITVPAYFNHAQRAATMEAAEIAGLKCDRLLNEPTAAALAYGHRKNIERTIVIFDLGGGTFDVSVLKLSDGLYEILASTGDTFLGGEDFDYRIVDHLADHFKARARVDPRQDRSALQRLKDAAERAKCELSFSDRTNIVIPHLASGESLEMVLTRSTLESLTTDLVDRCLGIARRAVSDAGLSLADIEEVILVGGQTRMPKVREAVTGVFGREPSRSVHPEEVVAIGAAVHAANLEAGEAARTVLLDVTPFDLGIDTAGGMFVPVISRNARVPASEGKVFATIADNQETVRITVRQGDNRTAVQNEFLGEFVLEGLTPAPRLQTKVDVTFRIDTNGMLHVAALERGKDERRNITIRNYAEHARSPAFPDADQARADELARKMRADQGAAAPKKSKSNGRGSLIDLLLRRNRTPASPAAANPATTGPASGEEAPSGTAGAEATGVDVAPLQTSSIDAPSIDAVAMAAAAMAAGAATGTPRSGSAAVFGTSSTARSRGGPPSTTSDIGGTLPEAEAATLLEEWNEADLTPADGIVLDPYVEPLPVAFDEDEAVVLDGGSGLSPFDEDVYEDAGAGASLGLAGGLSGAQAAENPFADLGNPASPPARDTSRSLSLSDLFLDEDGLGDVEVIDPFSARGRAMDETFAGIDVALDGESPATPRAGALPAAPPARGAPRGGSGFPGVGDPPPRVAPPGLPDDFDVLFGSPFSRPATADPLADPFGRPGAPEAPIPPPSFLQAPATSWEEDQRGLASDVTVFAAPDDQDDEPEGARQDAPALAEFDLLEATAGLDEIAGLDDIGVLEDVGPLDDLAVAGLPEEAGPADPDLLAGPQLLDPDLATVWEAHRPQGLPSWPRGRSTPEPVESTPTRTEAPATGFALLDPDTDVRAALAAAGVAATPAARKRAGTLDWMDAAVAADTEWSVTDVRSDVRSEAHTMPGADPAPSRPPTTRPRKPARVRLHYRELETFVNDARESLRRGGTFVRTERPLKVGRECVFEIAAPGLSEPLVLRALVTFVATAGPGQEAGMGVEYQLDETTRRKVEQLLNRL